MLEAMTNCEYVHVRRDLDMTHKRTEPTTMSEYPSSNVSFSRVDHVIMNPVEKPAAMLKRNGNTSRVPDLVGVSRRTAWN
jgi:hypothetical protein